MKNLWQDLQGKDQLIKYLIEMEGGLLGGESMSCESSNVIKMKVKPLRCRWRKNSIKKIYGI